MEMLRRFMRRPRECQYGNSPGAYTNCDAVVHHGEGVTYGFDVYCSEAHASAAQEDAIF